MTIDERKRAIENALEMCLRAGKVHTRGDFAALVGINRSVLSAALSGNEKYLTDSLVARVQKVVSAEMSPVPEPPKRQIVIPEETLELYTNLSETCRNLSAILARIGVPAQMPDFPPVQQNGDYLDKR